jgi:7-cyano-7-deazaguanine reductase
MEKNPIEGKYLGQRVEYPQQYSPEYLVAVPRSLNREIYGLDNSNLPFVGVDVWHAWELSFLTEKGLPVAGVIKLIYPADSPSIVESKSFKLYLNGFNMSRFGSTREEGISIVKDLIKKDLSSVLETSVIVTFFPAYASEGGADFADWQLLEELPEIETTEFVAYTETPALFQTSSGNEKELRVASHLLRSNCKITHQPDWGSAFIYIKGNMLPDKLSLLKYLVSIRNENHFHEEICEMIYKRLVDTFAPEDLMVTTIYTRRGGIDICPVRASKASLLPLALTSADQLSKKLIRQ